MSDYFDPSENRIVAGSLARSAEVNAIRDEVGIGFDMLPTPDNVNNDSIAYGVESGAGNAYVVTMPKLKTAYAVGMSVSFNPTHTNTGASTIKIDALGEKGIKRPDGSDVVAGDIMVGQIVELRYNGSNFVFTGSLPYSFHQDAEDAVNEAENARDAAQTAQGLAEDAQTASETAQGLSEDARDASQTAQGLSEDARDAAQTAQSNTEAVYDHFDDRYLGEKSSDPSTDNDGNALITGALYWNTTDKRMMTYTGTEWVAAFVNYTWLTVAASRTAVPFEGYLVNTDNGAVTISLPASPHHGDKVFVKDHLGNAATNNITIGRNGNNIENAAVNQVLSVDNDYIELVYDGAGNWSIVQKLYSYALYA